MRTIRGIEYHVNGIKKYFGYWDINIKAGRGISYYSNGVKYIQGLDSNSIGANSQDGRITTFQTNGTKSFEGKLVNCLRKGKGVLYDDSQNVRYIGNWEYSRKKGYGMLFGGNGSKKYQGWFKNDRYHGPGIAFHDNGYRKYKGEWDCGQKHGIFFEYNLNGDLFRKSQWEHDDFIMEVT